MRFYVIAVGKLKERFWVDACAEYLKRLKPYAKTEVIEIADVDPDRAGTIAVARAKEGEAILRSLNALPAQTHVVVLAIEGKQHTSESFANHLGELGLYGQSDVAFIIGGSDGVDQAVYDRAREQLSFGKITLPHNLARVVLLEQLYRAQKILRGEPYHK
ncbi:23S rRNA (pseudouridine(1915)-N(3))-methyltransferase RlmH [Eggerthellaceae bacterium 3-80]|nr:23S rRNA (pseudouridine(1915)-N(3))-methyltransferase RlmH [bacterium D16-34]